MVHNRETKILKGLFFIVSFYLVVEHFSAVKNMLVTCYDAIASLVYGIVIAFVVNLLVVKLEKYMTKGIFENQIIKRTISMVAAFLILAGAVTIVCFSVIPGIRDSVRQIAGKAPQAVETITIFLEKNFGVSEDIIESVKKIRIDEELVNSMFGLMKNQSFVDAVKASGNMVGNFFSAFAKLFIGLFFSFYILAKKESISAFMHKLIEVYLPKHIGKGLEDFGKIVYDTYASFISGQCVDSIILGILVMLVMGILRLPYPVLIGVIISVTNLIPVAGALFGGSIGVVLLIMESPVKALTFLILFLILQQIDNRLIYPHIVGNAIGIPSILIFAAIIIGGKIGGVLGMFLGIPFTAVLYTMLVMDMEKRRQGKSDSEQS